MSSIVEERALYDFTKKDKVIYLAKKDPFLKVDRISQLAETTPHYVRTVLSEANLSLTKLRKQYAQKLEGQQRKKNDFLLDILSTNQFDKVDLTTSRGFLSNQRERYSIFLKEEGSSLKRTLLFTENDLPVMVNTTIVLNELDNFALLKDRDRLCTSENKVRVEVSNQVVADLLNINSGDPVLTLEKEIYISEELRGVDLVYLLSDRVELLLKENGNQISILKCQ